MPRRDSSSDSERGSYRRRRDRKRNSSSPDSRGNSESSSDRIKRKTHRSRSRSGSNSRSSHRRNRSRSKSPRKHTVRSRSSSRGRSNRRSRSRSSSRSRRRPRSGSRKPYRRSRSTSPKNKSLKNKHPNEKNGDVIKQKVQQAIKAAATASAELREKGLLGDVPLSNSTPTINDQLKRAQALDEINAQSFTQQQFVSSRNTNKSTVTVKAEDNFDKDGHMSAIFGLSAPKLGLNTNSADASIKKLESWKQNPEFLVHESIFVDQTGKQERWLKKLFVMRKKKINEEM